VIDKEIIKAVCKDEDFINAIEYDMQMSIKEIWADWTKEILYYEFKSGEVFESKFSVVIEYLNTLNQKGH